MGTPCEYFEYTFKNTFEIYKADGTVYPGGTIRTNTVHDRNDINGIDCYITFNSEKNKIRCSNIGYGN
jgi:hypothetical protein